MPRRKKQTRLQRFFAWAKNHPRTSWGLVICFLIICFLPIRAWRLHVNQQKFVQTKAAMATVYDDVVSHLGQPDNFASQSSCTRPGAIYSSWTCQLETKFIYGVADSNQANIFLHQVQAAFTRNSKLFKPTKKLSSKFTASLVFDTTYTDALDSYSGPHSTACSVKYSYNSPGEVDLSLNNTAQKPFEVFITCSAKADRAYYPLADTLAK